MKNMMTENWKYRQKIASFIVVFAFLGSGFSVFAAPGAVQKVYQSLDHLEKIKVSSARLADVERHQKEIGKLLAEMKTLSSAERDGLASEDQKQLAGYFVLLYALEQKDPEELKSILPAKQVDAALRRVEEAEHQEETSALRFATEKHAAPDTCSYVPVRLLCVLVVISATVPAVMLLHRELAKHKARRAALRAKKRAEPPKQQSRRAPAPGRP